MKTPPALNFDLSRSCNLPCRRIKFHHLLNVNLILLPLFLLLFPPPVSAIRKDVSLQSKHNCRTTVQGRFFLTDDNGYVCDAFSVDPLSRCCPGKGDKFSCQGCNHVSQCCNSYEFCVSCCLNPATTRKELALKVKIAKPATAGNYASVFDYCVGRCRHSSASVVHENAYLSEFHHCFSISSNFSGFSSTQLEPRLAGINIIIGRQGESCDSACKSDGQSCVPNKLALLNQCDIIQKYMSCKGACLSSIGADQPAEVVDDAPRYLNPGACLYTRTESILSCEGSHSHTRRLCPCA
ncbi:upf0454 protein c12orf49 homolog [Phtheirospermum japonicum]|uniref:SREBP regulating gene protein n=1 Tax=Phtheirospermum japonicum TaxID=374723 RepID=A0A830DCY1_9LAMI|nr:upf0454 protein c12orf49 homolog [Phtheirospermum japonicum]